MSWWRHCSAAVPGPARPVLPFQVMSGLGDTLKVALKEVSSTWGSAKANANRYSRGSLHSPRTPLCPHQGKGKIMWLLKPQRHPEPWMMDPEVPPALSSPHPMPAVSCSLQRPQRALRAGTTGMLYSVTSSPRSYRAPHPRQSFGTRPLLVSQPFSTRGSVCKDFYSSWIVLVFPRCFPAQTVPGTV